MANTEFTRSITGIEKNEEWLINISINQSAVRNHGKGIVKGIRYELMQNFRIEHFMKALKANNNEYLAYIDELTANMAGKPARDVSNNPGEKRISWGAARKCINLLARSIVYNAFIWETHGITLEDFNISGIMNQLELPLDSYSVAGILKDCEDYRITIPDPALGTNFTILYLKPDESQSLQQLAVEAARGRNTCRIHLDIIYWRNNLAGQLIE